MINKISGINGKIINTTPDMITNAFVRMLKKNNIPLFRFHDLRHYAVSTLHAINVPDKYIMARGGWQTNYTMNNVYNHALKSKQSEYDEKISTHFKNVYNENKLLFLQGGFSCEISCAFFVVLCEKTLLLNAKSSLKRKLKKHLKSA